MMKSVAPMWLRLRHLRRPQLFSVKSDAGGDGRQRTSGQRLAEIVAAGVGSWAFLSIQAGFLILWLIYNTLQFTTHFDPPPYILLNLLLSFQAAFTGPVLLIAANVGAARDHKQADRIEQLSKQNEDLGERLLAVEQMLEQHVTTSLATHAAELSELGVLMRAVHAVVCAEPDGASESLPKLSSTRPRAVSRAASKRGACQSS